jgi:hypothetical protein
MTATTQPITARVFLFGDKDLVKAIQASGLEKSLRDEFAGFTRATRDEALRELGKLSGELLDLDLTTAMLGAWSRYAALKEAGRRTLAAPETEELVELLAHRMTLDHQPLIDLLVNGKRVATVHFVLMLEIAVEALSAVVRSGYLVGARVGRCIFDGSVSIEGKRVARRKAQLDLPFSIQLGSGIRIQQ